MKTKHTILFGLGLMLAGCSSGGLGDNSIMGVAAGAIIQQKAEKRKAGNAKASKVTQASLAKAKGKLVQIQVPNLRYKALAVKISDNNGYVNYRTGAEQSFTFKNGQLTSTNGLPYDLMAATTNVAPREYRYLTSVNSIGLHRTNCEITGTSRETITIAEKEYSTKLTEETCKSSGHGFKNKLWSDRNGNPRKAHQWIGFQSGFAIVEWLN
jgi:hypothetical protein